jgi:DNA-binding NarL/FixJ family response regulator
MTIRVLIAEDQAMVRGALSALLTLEDDFEIVAEISRGDEVVPAAWTLYRTWRSWTSRCQAATG